MTIHYLLNHQQESRHFCLLRQGLFFRAYNESALLLHELFGYQIKCKESKSCGQILILCRFSGIGDRYGDRGSGAKGLPIGNLASQWFGNFYLNAFDHYMKNTLGIRYYGRYVDDFVIVHPDREFLKALVPKIACFLSGELLEFRDSVNSYWRLMRHHNSCKLRKKTASHFSEQLYNRTECKGGYCKIKIRDCTLTSAGCAIRYTAWWKLFENERENK